MGRELTPRSTQDQQDRTQGSGKVRARCRMLVMPMRRLLVGSLVRLLLRAYSPLLRARRNPTSFLHVLILFRQNRQWQLAMERG